jgi:hypothetical protein
LKEASASGKGHILVDEELGDAEKLQQDQIRLQILKQRYHEFSKSAGLPEQYERMEKAGFTWKHGRAAEKAAKEASGQAVAKKVSSRNASSHDATKSANANPTKATTPKKYVDSTGKWHPDAKPNSHEVKDLQEVTVGKVTYKVDGRNVQLDYKPHEKEIAELLAKEVGGEVFMVPRVNNPQGISTPDYIFNGKAYDLKTLEKEVSGTNPIFNRVKKKKSQAHCFIIDVTVPDLRAEVIESQIDKIFWSKETQFVDEIVIVRDGKIEKVFARAKKKS